MMKKQELLSNVIEASIRISFLAGLGIWCFLIFSPFAIPTIWGIILAVGLYPVFKSLEKILRGRKKLAAALLTFITLIILFIPSYLLMDTFISNGKIVATNFMQGKIVVPEPPLSVNDWPIVGNAIYKMWNLSHINLMAAISKLGPQLKPIGGFLLSGIANTGFSILQFIMAIIIAGFLFAFGEKGKVTSKKICIRIMGDKGEKFAEIAGATIRSVTQGIIGVAFIQAALACAGFIFVQIPGVGLWTLLILVMAIVQIPLLIIFTPIIIYVFTYASTGAAIAFLIWCICISLTDPFLKPLLLGRGVQIPMPVILIGAIGGMLLSGFIGLFVGAVVFSLGYQTFQLWVNEKEV